MKRLHRLFAASILFSIITVGITGIAAFSLHHHEPGCPFMPGEQAVCEMTVLNHMSAWQDAFISIFPALLVILALGITIYSAGIFKTILDITINKLLKYCNVLLCHQNLLQQLFASGILNPKAP